MGNDVATVQKIVAGLNDGVARLLGADEASDRPVTSIELFDSADAVFEPGALVLAIGVDGEERVCALLAAAERDGVAGVVVKGTSAKIAADLAAGIAVVWLREDTSWMELAVSLRQRLIDRGRSHLAGDGSAANELFALADSISTLVGGPVTIESEASEVLAWSTGQQGADGLRVESILVRTVRPGWVRLLAEEGVLAEIAKSPDPVFVPAHSIDGQPMPRVAIAVRSGGVILGYIWIVVQEPLSEETAEQLRYLTRIVALQLAQLTMNPPSAIRQERRELGEAVFAGGPGAMLAADRLGLTPGPLVVLAIGAEDPRNAAGRGDGSLIADRRRIDNLFEHYLSAVHPSSVVLRNARVLYALLAWPGLDDELAVTETRSLADDFMRRSLDGTDYRIAVAPAIAGVARVAVARAQAGAILTAMLRQPGPASARLADVALPMLLGRLADYADSLDLPPFSGPLRALADEQGGNGQLLESLSAYFESGGVLDAAAARLHVHINTLRYRLRKVQEVSGLDLQDADSVLLAQLELRLSHLRRGIR
ncbi:PucR family transcriptional regulator [Nocardia sp. NPDC058058]|uniref:PucR family transcriptional regulator n=1 Tax=Nocardia sp. NPDC058058 TaxID=3346317 RepID=UPI0036DB9496